MATWLYRIGEAAARRAWAVILTWVLIVAGVAGAYTAFHGKLSNTFTMPGTQTQQRSPTSSPNASPVPTAAPARSFSPPVTAPPSPKSRSKHFPPR